MIVDYGRTASRFGDTLQALRRHEKVDPLASPGEADLTVHVDFPAILAESRDRGAACPALTQREFLLHLELIQRAEALAAARPDQGGAHRSPGRAVDR